MPDLRARGCRPLLSGRVAKTRRPRAAASACLDHSSGIHARERRLVPPATARTRRAPPRRVVKTRRPPRAASACLGYSSGIPGPSKRSARYHGIMAQKALTRATDVIDGAHPTRSVLRLLLRRPGRMTVAVLRVRAQGDPAVVPAGGDGSDHRHRRRRRRGVGRARLARDRRGASGAELSQPHPLHAQLHDSRARHRRRPPQRPRRSPPEPVDRVPHPRQRLAGAEQGRP